MDNAIQSFKFHWDERTHSIYLDSKSNLVNQATNQINLPIVFKVDYQGDRSVKASIEEPYPNDERFIGDMLALVSNFCCNRMTYL